MRKLRVGDRVRPNDACIREFGQYFTANKVYTVVSGIYGLKVLDDDIGNGYLPTPDKYFVLASTIYIGGE